MLVFYYVANADDQIDSAEVERLIRQFAEPERYKSDLFTQTIRSLMSSPEELEVTGEKILSSDDEEVYRQIAAVQKLVDEKIEASEASAFKHALVMLATDIAAATGEAELPVSTEEWAEVIKFKSLLKL